MSPRLPDYVDPWRLADREKRFEGKIALRQLHRLGQVLEASEGEVSYSLNFSRDEQKRACVTGSLQAGLTLVCQRCLGSLDYPVDIKIRAAAVEGFEEAERLPDELDPLLVGECGVKLVDLIEDELILALPQVPVHDKATCPLPHGRGASAEGTADPTAQSTGANPFASLAQLKRKSTDH